MASSSKTKNPPYYAFNGNNKPETINGDDNDLWAANTETNGAWIQYKFDNAVTVHKIMMQNRRYPDRAIYSFKIQGSNDGTTFIDVSNTISVSDITPGKKTYYSIPGNTKYLYWRYLIVSCQDAHLTALQYWGRS